MALTACYANMIESNNKSENTMTNQLKDAAHEKAQRNSANNLSNVFSIMKYPPS